MNQNGEPTHHHLPFPARWGQHQQMLHRKGGRPLLPKNTHNYCIPWLSMVKHTQTLHSLTINGQTHTNIAFPDYQWSNTHTNIAFPDYQWSTLHSLTINGQHCIPWLSMVNIAFPDYQWSNTHKHCIPWLSMVKYSCHTTTILFYIHIVFFIFIFTYFF